MSEETKRACTELIGTDPELMHPAVIPYKTVFTLQQLL